MSLRCQKGVSAEHGLKEAHRELEPGGLDFYDIGMNIFICGLT